MEVPVCCSKTIENSVSMFFINSCFLLQYTFPFIKSPMFVLNSLYDTAQLAGILGLDCLPPNCSDQQMKFFDNFRNVSQQIFY